MTEEITRIPLKEYGKAEAADRIRIGVAGISPGCGTSFISALIASLCVKAGKSTLVELGTPYFYIALGMEKRFLGRDFIFFRNALEGREKLRKINNREENINWLLRKPSDREELHPGKLFRLINSAPGDHCTFDCSGMSGGALEDVLAEMDYVVLVADPLPSKLIAGISAFERLCLLFPDAVAVINKMNPGARRSELRRMFGSRNLIELPHLSPKTIYSAEYDCALPCRLPEAAEALKKPSALLAGRLGL